MLVFTTHDAAIYDSCWYSRSMRFMLVFTIHAGIYGVPFVSKLKMMLVFTIHAGIYGVPFVSKLKMMLVFTIHAGIYTSCWYLHFMLVFTIHVVHAGTSIMI